MKRWVFTFVMILALGLLIGWRLRYNHAQLAQQEKIRQMMLTAPPAVVTASAKLKTIMKSFEGIGVLQSPLNVQIAPKVSEKILYFPFVEGDHVTKGQVLVRLDDADIRAQVEQQRATLAEAKYRLYQAILTQNPNNVSVNTQILQQQASLASAEANYNQVQQNYISQVASAEAVVTDNQNKVNSAEVGITNAKAQVESANANLNNAIATFNREENLYKQGYVAAQDADNSQTQVSVEKANLDVAQGQLKSAYSALASAQAELKSAQEQLAITKTTGKANIESSKASLNQTKAALQYAKSNTAQIPAYKQNLAALQATVNTAKAMLQDSLAQESYTIIRSPIDGYITARNMDPGSMAAPGQTILAIQQIRQQWAAITIPEDISRFVHLKQVVKITADALPGLIFHGMVTQINPAADPLSRQFTIRVTLNNVDERLKPGMFIRATIVTQFFPHQVVVPPEALQKSSNGANEVMLVGTDNKVQKIPVEVGESDPSGVAILKGLKVGDNVVVLSSNPLKNGQKVNPSKNQRQPINSVGVVM